MEAESGKASPTSHTYFSQRMRLHYLDGGMLVRRHCCWFMGTGITAITGIGSPNHSGMITTSLHRTSGATEIRRGFMARHTATVSTCTTLRN